MDLSTGLAEYKADVVLRGRDALAGRSGSQSVELESEYLISARGRGFMTDNWLLGGGLEWRRFDLSPVEIAGLRLNGDSFTNLKYVLDTRYFLPTLAGGGRLQRVRPFLGAEVFYVSDLDMDFLIEYEDASSEEGTYKGHGYYGYGLSGGLALQVTDDTLLELGGRWEQNFGGSDATVQLNPPGGESEARVEIDPEGWVFFAELSYSF